MECKVTVLTTVYNGLPYLSEAIESVLNQTYTNFEYLIIDDASTDESLKCILSYNDPRIKVIKNEHNIGQTASLNKGLMIANGEFIARLDQDDVNLPDRLEDQVNYLDAHPDLVIICSWEHTIESNGKIVRNWKQTLLNYGDFLGKILLGLCPVWHPSVMFRKDIIMGVGAFDTFYGPAEDYELWSRIAINRFNGAIVPKFHLLQRVHNQRQSHLQGAKQLSSTQRAHVKIIGKFVSGDLTCLAALLRLEEDPCGRKYSKKHIKELKLKINELLMSVKDLQKLSPQELKALEGTIYQRLGIGMRQMNFLSKLPAPLFYPVFYILCPLLLPGLRPFLSQQNQNFHKLINIFKLS